MSRTYFFVISLSVLFVSIAFAQTDTITILHVNDTHSCLAPLGPRTTALTGTQGGISRAATVIGMTKMTEQNVLTLHSGDAFIGDFFFNKFFGVAEFQLMASLGFDAMAIGNHEFDLTPAILDTALRNSFPPGAGFTFLSSNLILDDPQVQPLKDYIFPYTIKQYGNTKVGIFSLLTPETNYFSLPSPAIVDTNIATTALAMIDTLNSKGCNIIICLSHLGILYDQDLAANIPGIDVILSGHDHLRTDAPIEVTDPLGGTTYIVQADAFYKCIGIMTISVSGNNMELINYTLIDLNESVPEEPTVKATVDGLVTEIENTWGPVYSQQIGTATDFFEEVATNLGESGAHDTPVGNLVTDAYRWKTGTEIGITVGGLSAQPIYEGPLVAADAFRVVGYGFNEVNGLGYRIVKLKLTGADLIAGLEFGLSNAEYNDELFPQVSGMSYSYNLENPVGGRIVEVKVGDIPLEPQTEYSITINEFLYYALSNPFIIGTNINIIDPYVYTDSSEFQVLSEYIIYKQTISPEYKGNVLINLESIDNGTIPGEFRLEQNYPNPFNPSTTINYDLPKQSSVTLKIYNVTGEEVATLVNQDQEAGRYRIRWEVSRLSSGIYFYQLIAGGFVETKKMVLIR
ncbi:MAG TPA: 5'-nucleotidase C-terminal domain-containing protein [Ignavibacteriaceae bacterium]|nr:5'-nucleotidase C-terminal domain-containing protein [Ignavibacteriaceae bacterium]